MRRIGEKDFAETRALVADEQGARASQRRLADGSAFARDGGNGGDAMAVEEVERFRFGCTHRAHPEGGPGRGAESLGVPGACGARQQQNTTRSEGFGRTEKRADVAGILQAGENEDQGGGGTEDSLWGKRRRMDEGGDALRLLGRDGAREEIGRQQQVFGLAGNGEWRIIAFAQEDGREAEMAAMASVMRC